MTRNIEAVGADRRILMDAYYLDMAKEFAKNSPDRSSKVGCVIVRDEEILVRGYNTFPMGIRTDIEERYERPLKYSVTEHAERNAIFAAARYGISLNMATLYCGSTLAGPPCAECTRAIIQSGIKRVVGSIGDDDPSTWEARWKDSMMISLDMLKEAGIIFETV